MQKKMGMFVSFLFLCAVSLIGVGCSDNRCCDPCAPVWENPCASGPQWENPCAPVCPQPCAPSPEYCAPQPCAPQPCQPEPCARPCAQEPASICPPEPFCKILPRCKHPSQNELCCKDSIIVRAVNPRMCLLGEQYPLDFEVHACDDVCDVVVTTHLPDGVSFLRSDPEAEVDGRKLTWHIGPMDKGSCRAARVWLKCECEGELCACFCATATPVRFCALLCAKPILVCEKCGPERVCPGDPVEYTITVSNRGSCTAEDVTVVDNLPLEVEHASGLHTLTYKLGNLAPCETKKVNICTTAVKRGKVCNTSVVTACNADSVSCQACTCICCCAVDLVKVGTKELPIGKNADYQITLTNTGDLPLTDVVVTDVAPSATSIVSATGANLNGNQAVWRLRELKAGEKVTFNLTLTSCTPGCFTNRVSVTDCQNCNACAEYTTRWRGRPALNACITVSESPICIGDPTTYNISVVNQGSEADSNVSVVVRFPPEVTPKAAGGDSPGTVSGQTVTFGPLNNVRPRQTLNYRVDAVGKSSGDARIVLEVSSEAFKTPIVQQESTIVN